MKRTALFLISILLMATFLSGCVESTGGATSESEDITIGALLPLTGGLSSIGEASQTALAVSADDINGYFSGLGSGKNVNVIVKDTESNPEMALEQLKELDEMGITLVIGPQSSNEAEAVLEYANENGITLLSTASTAPSLAIPDDNLFRLVPDDTNQGMVLARFMQEDDISTVIPMYRNDVWGNGLSDEVRKSFEDLDGTVLEGVTYETENVDFSAEVESLNEKVVAATSENDAGSIAVVLCSYGEVTEIFALAQNYPALSDVNWYGTDGIALNKGLIDDNDAASFAATINVKAPIYGYIRANDRYQEIAPRIEEQLGRLPESYALTTYDALWIATFVDLDSIPNDDESVKRAMKTLTDSHFGMSGWTILDENGDRKYWNYDIWTVTEEDGSYQWELCGKIILPYEDNMLIMQGEELGFAQ
ncbi:ABC transporter substrate-binding protein [Methanococcoides methylutens]|uniref:ABC transporter substrate-binding protein n=1 Tax=Methanococcoides methylutens TaxID=2226 RepID=A0A099T365_METMT|nr:ABC transporter substrate-binding protein [Methanococcoides methylutens]KGK98636.1 ABC transporter substrate-binding protein [Methanococcoides methylutens]